MTPHASALRFIPARTNALLWTAYVPVQIVVFLLSQAAWQAGALPFLLLLTVHAYATVLCWLLIHEAIHTKLARGRRRNDAMGRVLGVLFGCPFHILRVGHMTHHRYNRDVVDTTELVPHDTRHYFLWLLAYYARILGVLYVSEVLAPLVFFFWRSFRRLVSRLSKLDIVEGILDLFTRPLINAVRIDAVFCLIPFALLIWINWDSLWPAVILFYVRALIVSYYDNAYHYGTDPEDVSAANNLAVAPWFQRIVLNHNMHRTHHRHPLASWAMLPELFARDGDRYDAGLLENGLAQLKGPVRRPATHGGT